MTTATMKDLVAPADQARPSDPYSILKQQLEGTKREFLPRLASRVNVDKFIRVVLTACANAPDLVSANRRSLVTSCLKCAADGLLPDGRDAALVVYNQKVKDRASGREKWVKMVQYQPMVSGLVQALYEGGEVQLVDATAVYEHDHFRYVRGDSPCIEHEPSSMDDPGELKAAYLIARLRNGQVKREVMYRRDLEKVRAVSKAATGDSAPWVRWADQMAIKSVIKRAAKQLPRSEKFDRIVAHDNEALGLPATSAIDEILSAASGASEGPVAPPPLENAPSETLDAAPWVGDVNVAEAVDRPQDAPEHDLAGEVSATEKRGKSRRASPRHSYAQPGGEVSG